MADPLRVLYVDDEPDLLDLGKLFLEESGDFSVTTVKSAGDALACPTLGLFDAVVADYQMPGMDGIALLKAIRKQSSDLPFILFTGRGREEIVIEAINNGADFYLQKGGHPEAQFAELAHKIRQAVAKRKSEREITSVFHAVPVGIAVVSERVLLRVNDYLCTMTGYSRSELEGKNTRFLYLKDEDYLAVGRMREQAYRVGVPDDIEVPWRRKNGSIMDVRITAATIDPSNPLAAMTFCALDITRAKRDQDRLREAYQKISVSEEELRSQYDELAKSEERLRKSEANLTGILRAVPVCIGLVSAGRVFLRVNDLFCRTIGYTREEIIGRETRFLYPDDEEYARAGTFYTLRSDDGQVRWIETRFVRKDGSVRDIRLFGTLNDPAHPAAGNIFAAMDITEEKQNERELRALYDKVHESEEKYRFLTEMTNDIIYAMDSRGIITYISPRITRYGYSPDEILSRNFTEFVVEEDLPAVIEGVREMLRTGIPAITRMRLRDKAGTPHLAEDSAIAIRTPSGTTTGIYGILRDISGRRDAEEPR